MNDQHGSEDDRRTADQPQAARTRRRNEPEPQVSSYLFWVPMALIVVGGVAFVIWYFASGPSGPSQVAASPPSQQVQLLQQQPPQQTVAGKSISVTSTLHNDDPNLISLNGQVKFGQGGFLQTWDKDDEPKIPGTQTDAMQAAIGDLQKQIYALKDVSANDKVEAAKALTAAVKVAEEKAANELQKLRKACKADLAAAEKRYSDQLEVERKERIKEDSELSCRIQKLETRLDEAFKVCPQTTTCECKCSCGQSSPKPMPTQK